MTISNESVGGLGLITGVNTLLSEVAKIINFAKDNVLPVYDDRSMAAITHLMRVEPLAIVSNDLLTYKDNKLVMTSMLNLFIAYYAQSVDILTTITKIDAIKTLDRLNPNRDESGFLLIEKKKSELDLNSSKDSLSQQQSIAHINMFSTENYKYSLPTYRTLKFATEDEKENRSNEKTYQPVEENANLSVGKLVNIGFGYSDENTGKTGVHNVNVNFRILANHLPPSSMVSLLGYKSEDFSISERFWSARTGRISFFRDFILCQDVIDQYKKAAIADRNNILQEIMSRNNNAKKYGLLTKTPSLSSASTLVVISEETAKQLESKLIGKLTSQRVKDIVFDNVKCFILAVVNRPFETVTFYIRGINAPTTVTIKELENKSKNNNSTDITEMLRSLMAGSPPQF